MIGTDQISTTRDGRSRAFWFGFFFFAAVTTLAALRTVKHQNHEASREVCRLIRKNYFRSGENEVREFLARCDREAEAEPWTFSRKVQIKRINRRLSELKTSHMSVYTPVENRQLWANEGLDTGLRARRIDGEIVVHRLLEDSPAERAGVKVGDAIVSVNGEAIDDDDVESTPGLYKVARGHRIFDVSIEVEDLADDLGPTLDPLGGGVGLLTLRSFLPQYFVEERWKPMTAELAKYEGLVIDLRGNAGGSFVASLRGLSPFFCMPSSAGRLWTTAESAGDEEPRSLPDDLRATAQLEALQASGEVVLRTFEGYGCFRKPVVVLIDDETSSVAEIFAQAFVSREKSRVWGTPTAGQVVMAKWFEIGSLGGGDFAMSIPIAGFRSRDGRELESRGVDPQKILIYDLEAALRGRDSWTSEAARALVSK